MRPPADPATRAAFQEIEARQVERRVDWVTVGSLGAGLKETVYIPWTGPASYSSGGEATTFPEGATDSPLSVLAASASGTIFLKIDHANGKVVAYDGGGNEIAAATNLSTYIGELAVCVELPTQVTLHRCDRAQRVSRIEVRPGNAITADASNYWDVRAYLIRDSQDGDTIEIGELVSTSEFSCGPDDPIVLLPSFPGEVIDLAPGDRIVLQLTGTGAPPSMQRPLLGIFYAQRR